MNLECPHCRVEVKIDPARLPAGRSARVACPRCREVFPLPAMGATGPQGAPPRAPSRQTGPLDPEAREWLERELRAMRDQLKAELATELLGAVGERRPGAAASTALGTNTSEGSIAIVAMKEPAEASNVARAVTECGFHPRPVADLKTALKSLDDEELRLVIIDKSFGAEEGDGAKLLEWLNRMPGSRRRNIFVAWLSEDVRTADGSVAFVRGANVVVNKADVPRLQALLSEELAGHEKFYRLFHEVMETING